MNLKITKIILIIGLFVLTSISFEKNSFAQANLLACKKGLGSFNKDGQFEVEKTFEDYHLFVSLSAVVLKIGRDIRINLYPVSGNPFYTSDKKRYYRFFSQLVPFDTAIWEVRYFIDDQIAKAYTADRNGNNGFPVGTALCPINNP